MTFDPHQLAGQPSCAVTIAPLDAEQPKSAWGRLARMGVRHVQLSATQPGMRPRELDRSSRRGLRTDLTRREMIVAGIDLWIPPAHLVNPEHIDKAVTVVLATIELAANLGRCPISMSLPRATGDETTESGRDEALIAIATHADRFGVDIADHALTEVPDNDQPHHRIGIGVDPPAWLAAGEDPAAAVSRASNRLVSARLCDLLTSGMRGPIGDPTEARLDVTSYQVALSIVEYARPIVIDVRQWADPWSGLQQTLQTWP